METIKYKCDKNREIHISKDEFALSPSFWDNDDVFLVYDHKQFHVKRRGFEPSDIFNYLRLDKEDKEKYEITTYDDYHIFPVDAYIHSGVSLSLAGEANFPDRRWDVSTTGYVLVKKKDFPEEDEARKAAQGVIEVWNTYLRGDVYVITFYRVLRTFTFTEDDILNITNKHKEGNLSVANLIDEFCTEDTTNIFIDNIGGVYADSEEELIEAIKDNFDVTELEKIES